MIPYLVISYILLGIGWIAYRSNFKSRSTKARRRFLHGLIVLSLILPVAWFLNTSLPNQILQSSNNTFAEYGIFDASCTMAELEAECSRLMLDDSSFCDCEEVFLNNVVAYRTNIWLNKLISWQPFALYLLSLVILVLLAKHMLKIRAILKLKGSAFVRSMRLGKNEFQLVQTPKSLSFSSFQFKEKYVIWPIHASLHLNTRERNAILNHELSHLNQKNTWEQLLLSLLQLMWFIHPVFYRLKQELVLLSEFIADEFALEQSDLSRKEYAHLLVSIKEQQLLAHTQGFQKHFLSHRVHRILDPVIPSKPVALALPVLIWLFASCLITFQFKNQLEPKWNEWTAYEKATIEHEETGRNYFCASCLID